MTAILFAPHGDDETLFAFYTMMRFCPFVVIVTYADTTRRDETKMVMEMLGLEHEQLYYEEKRPPWGLIKPHLHEMMAGFDVVISPAWLQGGHEHHNMVANIVDEAGPFTPLTRPYGRIEYLTYRRGEDRCTEGTEVIPQPHERLLKDIALECYESQQKRSDTKVWFGPDQREFIQ